MRKCYLKVCLGGSGSWMVTPFDRGKGQTTGDWLNLNTLPEALRDALCEGIWELRSFDVWNSDQISFPVHPADITEYPACYGNAHLEDNSGVAYICPPFLRTLIGKVRYKSLVDKQESHIAYVTVRRIDDQ